MGSGSFSKSLCWNCARCYGGCSWSRYFKPVKGWKAVPTIVKSRIGTGKNQHDKEEKSYNVVGCPLFKEDNRIECEIPNLI